MLPPFPRQDVSLFGKLPARAAMLRLSRAMARDIAFFRMLHRESSETALAAAPMPDMQKNALFASQFELQHRHLVTHAARAEFLLLSHGGKPAGRLYVDSSGDAVHLIDIMLLPALSGQGLGSALIAAIQERAAQAGKAMTLNVRLGNVGARRLYQRLGFAASALPIGMHLPMRWSA